MSVVDAVEWLPRASVLARLLNGQRQMLFCWGPVCLATGIGLYFSLKFEPSGAHYAGLCLALVWLGFVWRGVAAEVRPLPVALSLVIVGVLLAGARAHSVAGPVLGFRYYGPIEGRIVAIDRSQSDKVRLTLERVVLTRVAPDRIPHRVRVSLHGSMHFDPAPGLTVMMTGHLSPPQGPVEPGGFDFRRMAWFKSLGAVGYTRNPALAAAPADEPADGLAIHRIRLAISAFVQDALPRRIGAFAAAVTTGDRSTMDADTIEALRITNLAHLLAISGLHMGLLTGFVFAAARFLLALVPYIALRWPTKKIAAVIALLAGAFYYALSGGNVATERAFIMASVMFIGVLVDRRAITLRAVAIAATIVLTLRPETLVSPGFQMSFAATTALVAVFGALRDWDGPRLPRWASPIAAVVISSSVAGLATAPIAAAHFNRIADYGLLANLLAVPMMGIVVIPGAVVAALLAPLGLAEFGLAIMRPGIAWILAVADWVASFDGAATPVISPPAAVLPMLALAGIWLVLWQGWGRVLAVAPAATAFVLWAAADRPDILIAESGGLIGVMTESGRVLSKAKGDGFTARTWLENDGDAADQDMAFNRVGLRHTPGEVSALVGGVQIRKLRGRGVEDRLKDACESTAFVVVTRDLSGPVGCQLLSPDSFRHEGAIAMWVTHGDTKLVTARDLIGARLWSPK